MDKRFLLIEDGYGILHKNNNYWAMGWDPKPTDLSKYHKYNPWPEGYGRDTSCQGIPRHTHHWLVSHRSYNVAIWERSPERSDHG